MPQIRQWTKEKVALLIDGFSGHDNTCLDSLGQVVVYKFPPNVTSVYQPLDQGVICAQKASYKAKLLASLVDNAPNFESLQHMSCKLLAGHAGLKYGCLPHMSDVAEIVNDSWKAHSPSVVAGCWKHAHCLPAAYEAEIAAESHDYHKTMQQDTIQQMCNQLSSFFKLVSTFCHWYAYSMELSEVVVVNIEESIALVAVKDESDEDERRSDIQLDPLESTSVVKNTIALLLEVHESGSKLGDAHIMKLARDGCAHLLKTLASPICHSQVQ